MICTASLPFVLTALSPADWNSRNRRRISLWSAFSTTIASDDMVFPLVVDACWRTVLHALPRPRRLNDSGDMSPLVGRRRLGRRENPVLRRESVSAGRNLELGAVSGDGAGVGQAHARRSLVHQAAACAAGVSCCRRPVLGAGAVARVHDDQGPGGGPAAGRVQAQAVGLDR